MRCEAVSASPLPAPVPSLLIPFARAERRYAAAWRLHSLLVLAEEVLMSSSIISISWGEDNK